MTKELTALIIDDEPLARQVIRHHLADSGIRVVGECANGFDGLKAIQSHRPDIVFLDIQMPRLSGFEMLELLEAPPVVIFVTAYDQFAIQAFEVSAADYLLKPFDAGRFEQALERARARLLQPVRSGEEIDGLMAELDRTAEYLTRIAVKDREGVKVIPLEVVVRFEAQADYVLIVLSGGKHLKQITMKRLERRLDPGTFVRIHRSHILHLKFLDRLETIAKERYEVLLHTGERLPVSRSGLPALRTLLT